ncbi:MAG TPA: hypothetical protein VF487_03490 [Chitinophagaceae bacterium]
MNNFSEYYKTISNTELLTILENQGDYQSLAIEAAKNEFSRRELSELEVLEAKESITTQKFKVEIQKEKARIIEDKIKNARTIFFDTLNPIQSGIPQPEKIIRLIVIVFSFFFLYDIIKNYSIHWSLLKEFTNFPLISLEYFLPIVTLPVALFTFLIRKKIGWILFTFYLIYLALSSLSSIILILNWRPSGWYAYDNLFPQPSLMSFIVQLIFLLGILFVVCKSGIRQLFFISKQKMILTISLSILFTLFLFLPFL